MGALALAMKAEKLLYGDDQCCLSLVCISMKLGWVCLRPALGVGRNSVTRRAFGNII